jgi:hypothetical protein
MMARLEDGPAPIAAGDAPTHPVMTGAGKTTVRLEAHIEHAGKMLHRVRVQNVGFLEERLRARHEPGVQVEQLEDEAKKVRQREFVFYSDEPAFLGGDDEHPAPLEYFAAGIGT